MLAFSSVNASDVNETLVASNHQTDDLFTVEDNNEIVTLNNQNDNVSVDEDVGKIGATENDEVSASTGTFTDLKTEINNMGNVLILNKNYFFNSKTDSSLTIGITISKSNITIDGSRIRLGDYSPALSSEPLVLVS